MATLQVRSATIACFALLSTVPLWAAPQQNSRPRPDPNALIRKVIDNELQSSSAAHMHFMFRGVKTTDKGSVTRVYIETREGTAGMIVAYDGKPLTPEQRKDEEGRVQRFISDPDELKKKRKQEEEDDARTQRIVRALPSAFIFQDAGDQPASPGIGAPGSTLVKLSFHPNPKYDPPSRIEQVLTGMEGYVLVDPDKYRIAFIDGTLFREVSFGWGILGHLNRGGHFIVGQQMAANGNWEVSRMSLDLTGRILLAKKLVIKSEELFSDFRPVPLDLSFAQAFEMLKKEQATVAENTGGPKTHIK
jgi:hypothetical protein